MNIRLSDHFTCRRLLRFTLPSIVMMIFTSIYGVVDGFFVSNFVGKTPFAAINLIMPFLMAFGALGFMIGTGGSALVAKTLGEGKRERANGLFSMLIVVTLAMGALVAAAGMPLLRPAARVKMTLVLHAYAPVKVKAVLSAVKGAARLVFHLALKRFDVARWYIGRIAHDQVKPRA